MQAYALGVGEIEWKSTLNQPLDAEISLFAVGSTNQFDINVKLAPYEAYKRADIEYPSVLQDLKFSVKERKTGGYYIKVTSHNVIKDPFLDILVEIDWPSGHLLREFTVLLDLPVMIDQASGPVSSPVASALRQQEPGEISSLSPADTAGREMGDGAAAMGGGAAATGETGSAAGSAGTAGGTSAGAPIYGETNGRVSNDLRYGMVKRGDTLWGIAESMRTDKSVSIQQIMMALLKANPEAFYDNNINNLKAGYVLRLDDPSQLTEMSKSDAAREAQRQYQSWLAKKNGKTLSKVAPSESETAEPAVSVGEGAETGDGEPSLKLVSPDEAEVTMGAKAGGGAGKERSLTSNELESLRQELTYALEASDSGRQENTQLRARIAELEEQINEMQRLLSLRDDALSVLQAQPKEQAATATGGGKQEAGVVAPVTGEPVAPGTSAGTAAEPGAESPADAAGGTAAAVGEGPTAKPATEVETQPGVQAQAQPGVQPAEQPAAPAAQEQKVTPAKPVKPAKPASEKGIVDVVMGYVNKAVAAAGSLFSPKVLGGVIGGVLLLGGVFWFIRKRRISGDDLEQSMMIEVADKQLSEDMANGTISDLSEPSEETSAVDLLATADGSSIDAEDIDEIDVLAEADVYLAYQRFDRAEELLRDSLENEPQRHDLMLKLMEVFDASGNSDGFIEMAERCKASGGEKDKALWRKVVEMGGKIAASHPLFSGAVPAIAAEGDDEDDDGDDSDLPGADLGMDFGDLDDDLSAGSNSSKDEEKSDSINNLSSELEDLDFGVAEFSAPATEEAPSESDAGLEFGSEDDSSADNSLNFDMDELSSASATDDTGSGAKADTTDNSLEFEGGADSSGENSLEFDVSGLSTDDETTTAASGDANALEFESDGLESIKAESPAFSADDDDTLALSDDDISGGASEEMSDDLDWLTSVTDDIVDGEEDGSSFFSSEDEVATKLDLIRAYIDMGDNDSAKNILDEVVDEGNDEQKQEAQELLRQIG